MVYKIPMQVHVIESATVDRLENDVCRGMGGESDVLTSAFILEIARRFQATAPFKRPIEKLVVIDSVQ